MKHIQSLLIATLALFVAFDATAAMPSSHTRGVQTDKATGTLKPGEYYWNPSLSPSGPVIILVSLPEQTLYAYRNGILVARSSISSGTKGHSTPTGVFTILQKKQQHYSNLYQNAPMPNMQRLTWQGVAMHSGNLPGYPASHGCIRMPYDFSLHLFTLTTLGCTVVISDDKSAQPHFAVSPGLLLTPRDFKPDMARPLPAGTYWWEPDRSTAGPVAIMISSSEKTAYVYRNGNLIGRAPVSIETRGGRIGEHVYVMLNQLSGKQSPWAPGRPGHEWMTVDSATSGRRISIDALAGRIHINPEFAHKVYDVLQPGATIMATDEAATRKTQSGRNFVILDD